MVRRVKKAVDAPVVTPVPQVVAPQVQVIDHTGPRSLITSPDVGKQDNMVETLSRLSISTTKQNSSFSAADVTTNTTKSNSKEEPFQPLIQILSSSSKFGKPNPRDYTSSHKKKLYTTLLSAMDEVTKILMPNANLVDRRAILNEALGSNSVLESKLGADVIRFIQETSSSAPDDDAAKKRRHVLAAVTNHTFRTAFEKEVGGDFVLSEREWSDAISHRQIYGSFNTVILRAKDELNPVVTPLLEVKKQGQMQKENTKKASVEI
jgi:hypothetical protein